MEVLYSTNYIQRDLYVLKHEGKYIMVYRSSGLNPGRKGRILPFNKLADPERATLGGHVPGYIYKEFYFNKQFVSHRKEPWLFGNGVVSFLEELEEFLSDKIPEQLDQSYVNSYTTIRQIARGINTEIDKVIKNLEPFDWATLN